MKTLTVLRRHGAKLAAASTLAISGFAAADLPAVIGTTLTAVQADALSMADLVWPIVMAVFGAALLFKLFKRFGAKI